MSCVRATQPLARVAEHPDGLPATADGTDPFPIVRTRASIAIIPDDGPDLLAATRDHRQCLSRASARLANAVAASNCRKRTMLYAAAVKAKIQVTSASPRCRKLAGAADRFHQPEALLRPLPLLLTDGVARMARRPAIDRTAPGRRILCHVWGHLHRAQFGREVARVVGFVAAGKRDAPLTGDGFEHHQRHPEPHEPAKQQVVVESDQSAGARCESCTSPAAAAPARASRAGSTGGRNSHRACRSGATAAPARDRDPADGPQRVIRRHSRPQRHAAEHRSRLFVGSTHRSAPFVSGIMVVRRDLHEVLTFSAAR